MLSSYVGFFQLCLERALGILNFGFHPFLIDPYFSLHYMFLDLEHEAELFVKVMPCLVTILLYVHYVVLDTPGPCIDGHFYCL
jgi:hypothetical protein